MGRLLLRQTAAYGFAGIAAKLAALVAIPILTRILGSAQYGLADLATSFAALMILVARFGGEVPAARTSAFATRGEQRQQVLGEYVGTTAVVSAGVAVCCVPFIGTLTEIWNASPDVSLATLSIVLIPIGTVQLALVSTVRLSGQAFATAVLATVDLMAQLLLAVLFVAAGLGPLGVLIGYVVGSLIGLLAAYVYARPLLVIGFDLRRGIALIKTGLPYLPVFVAFVFADQLARWVTASSLGSQEVGHLALAFRIAGIIALASAAFSLAWGPIGLAYQRTPESSKVFEQTMMGFSLTAVFGSLVLGLCAPEVVAILGGQGYSGAAAAVPTLVWAAALAGTFFILTTAAGVAERGWSVAGAATGGASLQVVVSALLAPVLGIAGIGVAAMLGRLVSLAFLFFALRQFVPLSARLVVLIAGGSVSSAILQVWVVSEPTLSPARLIIAVAAIAVLVWIAGRGLRGTLSDAEQEGRSAGELPT